MKLFVVNETSANPDDWDSDSWALVLASDAEEALRIHPSGYRNVATEIPLDKAMLIWHHYVDWDSHWT